jgi:UDPglucose--hexose-1-phosphate uridylyltransferase
MSFLRKDPFGAAWVLISPERGLDPADFAGLDGSPDAADRAADRGVLAPGREAELPAEIVALRPSGAPAGGPEWRARVVPLPGSPFAARPFVPVQDGVLVSAPAAGAQELIVEHPDAAQRLETFPSDHLVEVLRLYRDRVAHHAARPEVRHVQVSRNVGRAAGARYDHPHGQLLALPVPNRWVEEEREAAAGHRVVSGRCLFCDVLDFELLARERIVSANEAFVAFAPFAAKSPFETWVMPRDHQSAFQELAGNHLPLLADLLRTVLEALDAALDRPPYNLVLHTIPTPADGGYHWHLELLPRVTRNAGFDWSLGAYVNPTPPEAAAHFLREAIAGVAAGVAGEGAVGRAGARAATVRGPS